jgi:hypothetical protein
MIIVIQFSPNNFPTLSSCVHCLAYAFLSETIARGFNVLNITFITTLNHMNR